MYCELRQIGRNLFLLTQGDRSSRVKMWQLIRKNFSIKLANDVKTYAYQAEVNATG